MDEYFYQYLKCFQFNFVYNKKQTLLTELS